MDLLPVRACVLCTRSGPALCSSCRRRLPPPPVTRVRGVGRVPAVFAYDGPGATVVQSLKYRDGRRLVGALADALVPLVDPVDGLVVTWAPTSPTRRRERGFDQAELLARAVARRLGAPARELLHRRRGPSQVGQGREARDRNVAFDPVGGRHRRPVLLVDDVCTTGATLRAAVAALGEPGGVRPRAVVVARTP